jgi:hypothetical protein
MKCLTKLHIKFKCSEVSEVKRFSVGRYLLIGSTPRCRCIYHDGSILKYSLCVFSLVKICYSTCLSYQALHFLLLSLMSCHHTVSCSLLLLISGWRARPLILPSINGYEIKRVTAMELMEWLRINLLS